MYRKVTAYRLTVSIAEQRVRKLAAHIDVLRALRSGTVSGEPEMTPRGEWKVKMVRQIRGAREVGVVTIILRSERLFIKTVEWEDLS